MVRNLVFLMCLTFPFAAKAVDPIVPDPALTPGAWNNPPTSLQELCHPGHAKLARHVDQATKNAVFLRYGYDPKTVVRGEFEIDHLVSLELDGTNAVANLWPESYVTQPLNAHTKDVLEDKLHHLVCSGQITLAEAQHAIATDWVIAYKHYVLVGD